MGRGSPQPRPRINGDGRTSILGAPVQLDLAERVEQYPAPPAGTFSDEAAVRFRSRAVPDDPAAPLHIPAITDGRYLGVLVRQTSATSAAHHGASTSGSP